jgi:Putative glycosyl/glycerophosphate transferases involved in teichoic acid biosynthesis TagF/TagB/EpsJ/RodC
MDSPEISVIVPIYNVQQYLEACLDSLVDQTFNYLEVIMVNDGSTDKSGDIMHKYAAEHDNFFAYDKPNGGLGQARNYGLQFARGKYIAFVDSDDIVVFDAYAKMFASAEETHSDIVIGNVMRFNSQKTYASVLHQKIFSRTKLKAHISRDYELIYDTTAWNKLFRKSFWDANNLKFPEHMLYEDIPVTLPAHYLAQSVDVLDDVVYYWRSRDFGDQSITQDRTDIHNLQDRLKAISLVNDFFAEHQIGGGLLAEKDYKLLNTDLLVYLNKLTEAKNDFIDLYFREVSKYLKTVPEEAILKLWPIDRMKYYFVEKMDKQKVMALLQSQKSGGVARTKIVHRDGHYESPYLFHDSVPESLLRIDDNLQVGRKTRTVVWEGHALHISGYAFINKIDVAHKWSVKASFDLVNEDTGVKIPIKQVQIARNLTNTIQHGVWSRNKYLPFLFVTNYNWSDINLSVPLDDSVFSSLPYGHYIIEGTIQAGGLTRSFNVGSPVRGQKARPDSIFQSDFAIHIDYGSNWDLHIIKEKVSNFAENAHVSPGALTIAGRTGKPEDFNGLVLRKWKSGSVLRIPGSVNGTEFHCEIPLADLKDDQIDSGWDVQLASAEGTFESLFMPGKSDSKMDIGSAELDIKTSRQGCLFFKTRRHGAEIQSFTRQGSQIYLSLAAPFLIKSGETRIRLMFLSTDHHESLYLPLRATNTKDENGRCLYSGAIDLTGSIGIELLKHFAFQLYLTAGAEADNPIGQYPVYSDELTVRQITIKKKVYTLFQEGSLTSSLNVSAKWSWIERGKLRRAVLRRLVYPAARLLPMKKKTIIFESYWGRSYECNPRALYEYVDKNYPEFETVLGLENPLTNVAGRGKVARRDSIKYYYYLARAKYFVNNVNFPDYCHKRKGAVELQTMHGTPLKTLGLDAPGEVKPGKNMEMYLAKNRRWDYLCVPSDYVAGIAKRAFKHRAQVIRSGYPRNDKLFQDNRPDRIDAIKKNLNIPLNKKVILYAPTWRAKNYFKMELDLPRLKKALGNDYVLIVKFHHFVASSVHLDVENMEDFVYNESAFDDIRDLYLISDILITDYSSVMFDFSLLDRPILLFTYDLENYRDNLRGMYFDIVTESPGPLCMTNDELIHELTSIDHFTENYGDRLEAFRSRFNTYDHGNACEQCFNALTGH